MRFFLSKTFVYVVFFFYVSSIFHRMAWAENKKPEIRTEEEEIAPPGTILLRCRGGNCRIPRANQKNKATHMGFTLRNSQRLLRLKQNDPVLKKRIELQQRKLSEKENIIKTQKMFQHQAEKVLVTQTKRIGDLERINLNIQKENRKLSQDIRKLKGERLKFLVIGLSVGAAIVLASGIGVVVYVSTRN